MFRAMPDTAPPADTDVIDRADLIPLSHLALDLPEPPVGWRAFLADRGTPDRFRRARS
jgi:hypothetical protein